MKILYIEPVGTNSFVPVLRQFLSTIARSDNEIEVKSLEKGPIDLEYHSYSAQIAQELLSKVKNAEDEGYNAAIIGCFYDPELMAAREVVKMPVVGVGEASMHLASLLGSKFSILIGRRKWLSRMENNAKAYGFESRIASWRILNLSVSEMADIEKTKAAAVRESEAAISEDGAEVIVLGCTGLSGIAKELQESLGIPVIDPVVAGLKFAELLADLREKTGISHSKIYAYENPQQRFEY